MLINVKMPIIVVIFNIYEPDKFDTQLSWAWKKFYNLGAWFFGICSDVYGPVQKILFLFYIDYM